MSYQWKKGRRTNLQDKWTLQNDNKNSFREKKTHWGKIQFFVQKFNSNKNLEFMRENSNMSFLRIES